MSLIDDLVADFTTSIEDPDIQAKMVDFWTKVGGHVRDYSSNTKVTVGTVSPTSPAVNDIWIDTN